MAIEQPNFLLAALALEAVSGQNDQINIVSANGIDVGSFVRSGPGAYLFSLREPIAVESMVIGGMSLGVTQAGTPAAISLQRAPNNLPPYPNLTDFSLVCFQASDGAPMDSTCTLLWFNVRTEFDPINVT